MSDIDKVQPGIVGKFADKIKGFVSTNITGQKTEIEPKDEVAGTWSEDRTDFMGKVKVGTTIAGGIAGAGMGIAAAKAEPRTQVINYQEPLYQKKDLGYIPNDQVTPGIDDTGTYPLDPITGRPTSGRMIQGQGILRNADGSVKMVEKTATVGAPDHTVLYGVIGAVAGMSGGYLLGVAINTLDKIFNPEAYPPPPPPPPPWTDSHSKAPWADSHNEAPWHDSHSDQPWHDSHYDNPWHNSHSEAPPWHNSHSESPPWHNSHNQSPAWSKVH